MKEISYFGVLILLMLFSCGGEAPKTDPTAIWRKKAEKTICGDIRSLTYTSVDAVSMGIGSIVMKSALSESEQDSLIMKPFIPVLRAELKHMDKKSLEAICKEKTARYKFIGTVLVNNRESITSAVQKTCDFAAPMINKAIELAGEMAAKKGTKEKSSEE